MEGERDRERGQQMWIISSWLVLIGIFFILLF
jgi:hypothetical protein